MPTFLVFITAFCAAYLAKEGAQWFLERLERQRHALRLRNLRDKAPKSMPLQGLLQPIENLLRLAGTEGSLREYSAYLSRLIQRMNRPEISSFHLIGYQLLLSMGSCFLFLLLSESLFLSFAAFCLGAALPLLWANEQALLREKKLLRELPNALEILSLCSEAGLTLEQGMDQYLRNAQKGPLKEEFSGILEQTRSGASRKSALEAASNRLKLTDFSLFSTSLIQAERFGTGVSKTLRQLSLTMRDKQSQRAEKAVQEMPVKLLFPLILCIMPVTFLIIFGPVLLQFLNP
ncbi:MAG TPA: type II secretion system F family protein [bacterium]|nr:type II secretion system F family protein [bacterium]